MYKHPSMISMMISLSACLIIDCLLDTEMPPQIPGWFGFFFLFVCVDILLEKCSFWQTASSI